MDARAPRDGRRRGAWPSSSLLAVGLAAGTARTEDAALAARRLLAGVALEHPLVLVLDDVHWAAPAFLDLVESLVELVRAPVLVLCLARPDLLDVRPHWGGGRLSSSAILLDALAPAESEALLDRLAVEREARQDSARAHPRRRRGEPALHRAAARGGPGGRARRRSRTRSRRCWRRASTGWTSCDRAVVQAAAVCGASFTTEDVATLVDGDTAASLVTLVRRELVRPGEAGDLGAEGWSFRHALIRDVAYGSIPKRRRAELHERLAARAIDRGTDGGRVGRLPPRAGRTRAARGGRAGPGSRRALTARAAEHLRRAGVSAYDRADMAAASSLLQRANELLPREAPERVEVLLKLGDALAWAGERDAARALLAEAHAVAAELGDERLIAWATLVMGPGARVGRGVARAAAARDRRRGARARAGRRPRGTGDRRARPLPRVRPRPPARSGGAAVDRARSTRERQAPAISRTTSSAGSASRSPGAPSRWMRRSHASRGSPRRPRRRTCTRPALGALGLLRAQKGEFEEARALVTGARRALEELGLRQTAAAHSIAVGEVEVMAGDETAAERVFRDGFDALNALRDEHTAANVAWRLGLLLARQGRDDEAERFVRVAEDVRAPGLWIDVWWRVVLALVAAHRGADARARERVAEARGLMAPVRESGMHADALLECAEALRAVGREDEAAALVAEAAGIAERLGYVVALRRAEDAQRALTE